MSDASAVLRADVPQRAAVRARPRRHRAVYIAGAVALLLVALVVALRLAAPSIVRSRLIAAVRKDCPACTLRIGDIDLSVLAGRATARDVRYEGDARYRSWREVRAARVQVDLDVLSWLRPGAGHIRQVVADDVVLREHRDADHPEEPERDDASGRSRGAGTRVERVEVHRGTIEYVRHLARTDARVRFENVELAVGAFGTRAGLAPRLAPVRGEALLQGSGRLRLNAQLDLLSRRGDGRIALTLRDQALAPFNQYLRPRRGVTVAGTVSRAEATMVLDDGRLRGRLTATYRGLNLDFERSESRGTLRTLVSNVAEHFVVANERTDATVALRGTREADQSMVRFVWASLRDGIQRLIRGEDAD